MAANDNDSQGTLPADAGALPLWREADLPEPAPLTPRGVLHTIGPGAILLAAAIGSGEWIVGPMITVEYGRGILWIATVAILLQVVFNLAAIRYTLYTGEPILTGIMRLRPGAAWWGIFFIALAVAQLGIPALAASCAGPIFAAVAGHAPQPPDARILSLITIAIVVCTAVLLASGRTVERFLERLSWFMIIFIFLFLLVVNVLFVPWQLWQQTALGFFRFGYLPANVDWVMVGVFAALAGSGGVGNLVISNWFRDKGFAMGSRVGAIGGLRAANSVTLAPVGCVFPTTTANLRRWRGWWTHTLLDQVVLWCGGCVVGMFLNVNLAAAIIPQEEKLQELGVGIYQAQYLASQLWHGFWALTLLNGFWILFSTHLGNTDCLVRLVCDIVWAAFPRVQRWRAARVYAGLLAIFTLWAVFAANWGTALSLVKILGIVAAPTTAVSAVLIARVDARFLPPAVRLPVGHRLALWVCAAFYTAISIALFCKVTGLL
jgi:Mn2+/Fe2+ NRAMP family transporter